MPTWIKKYRRCVERLEDIKQDEQEMRESINKPPPFPWLSTYNEMMSERCNLKIEYYKSRYGKHKIFKSPAKSKKYAHE